MAEMFTAPYRMGLMRGKTDLIIGTTPLGDRYVDSY